MVHFYSPRSYTCDTIDVKGTDLNALIAAAAVAATLGALLHGSVVGARVVIARGRVRAADGYTVALLLHLHVRVGFICFAFM